MKMTRKVNAAGLGGAVTVVILWIYGLFQHVTGFDYDLGEEAAASLTAIVMYLIGWYVKDSDDIAEERAEKARNSQLED